MPTKDVEDLVFGEAVVCAHLPVQAAFDLVGVGRLDEAGVEGNVALGVKIIEFGSVEEGGLGGLALVSTDPSNDDRVFGRRLNGDRQEAVHLFGVDVENSDEHGLNGRAQSAGVMHRLPAEVRLEGFVELLPIHFVSLPCGLGARGTRDGREAFSFFIEEVVAFTAPFDGDEHLGVSASTSEELLGLSSIQTEGVTEVVPDDALGSAGVRGG